MSIASARIALLAVIANDREARCRSLAARAEDAARALLREARRELAGELRARRDAVRAQGRAERAAADARLQAAARMWQQRRDAQALAAAWALLAPALHARWQDDATRRAWLERAIVRAAAHLPAADWQIRVAPPWTTGDADWLRGFLARLAIKDPHCSTDTSLPAGIEIRAGNARVDATPAGLLADRSEIEGRLLAALEAT